MSMETIQVVMDELRKVNFTGFIELAGRGEPSLHNNFVKVVDMLTAQPRTWKVRVTTNGYKIKSLWEGTYSKIDELILNTYTNEKEYTARLRKYEFLKNGRRVEHYFKPDTKSIQEINSLGPQADTTTTEKKYFRYVFNNRAGSFSNVGVDGPCWHPMRQIFIDYKGNYQMCCNDWKYQIKIGNIHERSMIDMYVNDQKLNRIRWSLINGRRQDILPCKMCDDTQGISPRSIKMVETFKGTDIYKFHVCTLAAKASQEEREEVRGVNLIPIYEID